MAAAAVAAGADGLIVEVHPDPETALSDGYQSLNFQQFEQLMTLCRQGGRGRGQEDRPERIGHVEHVSNVLDTMAVEHVSNVPDTLETCPTAIARQSFPPHPGPPSWNRDMHHRHKAFALRWNDRATEPVHFSATTAGKWLAGGRSGILHGRDRGSLDRTCLDRPLQGDPPCAC